MVNNGYLIATVGAVKHVADDGTPAWFRHDGWYEPARCLTMCNVIGMAARGLGSPNCEQFQTHHLTP